MNRNYVISRNGNILSWEEVYKQYPLSNNNDTYCQHYPPMDASTLLQRLPRGAYTTCRTVKNGAHVYQFDYHMKRLEASSVSVLQSISASTSKKETKVMQAKREVLSESNHPRQEMIIIKESLDRDMVLNYIHLTLEAFQSLYLSDVRNGSIDDKGVGLEFRITLLVTCEQRSNKNELLNSALFCHIGVLKNISPSENIRVLVHGYGRENASVKDSKWVTDRKLLIPSDGYEEMILINDDGELLEGTQTNFYVVKNLSTIITANEGVLCGSVRDAVLRVCSKHDIQIEMRPPTLKDLKCATGVFITSTSRLVMPVNEVDLCDLLLIKNEASNSNEIESNIGDSAFNSAYQYNNCPTIEKIKGWVLEDVETHSTSLCA